MINVYVHNSIYEVSSDEWDEIVSDGQVFQTHAWLALLEDRGLDSCNPTYIVFRNNMGQMIAHVSAYTIKTSLMIFSQGFGKYALDYFRSFFPNFLYVNVLECGCPLGPSQSISLKQGTNFNELSDLFCETLEDLASARNIRIVAIRDFSEEALTAFSDIRKYGYGAVRNLPTMEVLVTWSSFSEFLATMRSRFRQKVMRGLKIAKKSGLKCQVTNNFSELASQLAIQRENVAVFAKEYYRERILKDFYANAQSYLQGKCRLLQIFQGQKMVAHAFLIIDGPTLRWLSFGREKAGTRDGAYFLTAASIIEFAIQNDFSSIDMGMTTHSPKTDFGANMLPLTIFLRFRVPLLNNALIETFRFLNPVPSIMSRRVFNSTKRFDALSNKS